MNRSTGTNRPVFTSDADQPFRVVSMDEGYGVQQMSTGQLILRNRNLTECQQARRYLTWLLQG